MTDVSPVVVFRELLVDLAVGTAIAGQPIRTVHRDPDDVPPFMLVAEAGSVRRRSGPAYQPARVSLTAVALTDRGAADAYLCASGLLHRYGPVRRGGIGLFKVSEETGLQQPFQDPDTEWWRGFGVFDLVLLDRVLV